MAAEIIKTEGAETGTAGPVIVLLIAAAAMATGIVFAYLAWTFDSFRDSVAAVLLLFTAPALAVAAILARNAPRAPDEHTPALELMERLQRLEVSLRAVQLARAHIYVGASYAVVLGISHSSGMIASRDFVLFYAAVIVVSAACYLPWTARQEARMQDQRAICRQLLGERRAARTLIIE